MAKRTHNSYQEITNQSLKKLIEFGHQLVDKGRTPREIYAAMERKASNKEELNEALEFVFKESNEVKMRSPEKITELLKANKLKLNFHYSLKGLPRIAAIILIIGAITFSLSKEEVNQNGVFGLFTLTQGVVVSTMVYFVKSKSQLNLLLPIVLSYFIIFSLELLFAGIPNDLLEVYNHQGVKHQVRISHSIGIGIARFIGLIFPYIYLSIKIILGIMLYTNYNNYVKFTALSAEMKVELNKL